MTESYSTVMLAMLISFSAPMLAQPYTPSMGSAERKAIMDSLREPVQKELRQEVTFKIQQFKVQDGWAFLTAVPQKRDGTRVNYRGTRYEQAVKDEIFDDWICALLRKKGERWQVVTYVIGATDVAWEPWPQQYQAPAAIFR